MLRRPAATSAKADLGEDEVERAARQRSAEFRSLCLGSRGILFIDIKWIATPCT
jgi:hypothetical protein